MYIMYKVIDCIWTSVESLYVSEIIVILCLSLILLSIVTKMATEQREDQVQELMDPFSGLNIDPHKTLEGIKDRSHCPKCNASRKYFCYNCIIPMPEVATDLRAVSVS